MHIKGQNSAIAFGVLYARLEDFVSGNLHRRTYAKRWVKRASVEFGAFDYCMIMLGLDAARSRTRFLRLSVKDIRDVIKQFREREET